MKIVADKHTPYVVEAFSTIGRVQPIATAEFSPEVVRDADMIVVRSETKVNRALLEGSNVRFVGTVTIGTDHIDLEYLREKGIAFASAPGSNANSVAEYLAAALLRFEEVTHRPLKNQILGVVGVGNVGSKVAKVGESLGMKVVLNDPPLARETHDAKYRPLDELMQADVITIHVPLTKSGTDPTVHLFEEKRIRRMKTGSVLVNTSRGSVVETGAIKRALGEGHLSAAILDVWENEPVIDMDLLRSVMIGTSHIAGYSLDGKINAVTMVYEAACRAAGVAPTWTAKQSVPPAQLSRCVVNHHPSDPHVAVREVVGKCYDILEDDAALRAVAGRTEPDGGSGFARLRSGYRVRREFWNTTVEVPKDMREVIDCLRSLKFKVEEV